jgi:hypothetical protein
MCRVSRVVVVCHARAAKRAEVLTNSENAAREAKKAVESVRPPLAWRANPDRLEAET